MSANLKMFVDRLSDLITTKKELGRKLKGKNLGLLSTNYDGNLNFDFAITFKLIAKYLHLNFIGHLHSSGLELENNNLSDKNISEIRKFSEQIN